MKKITRVLIANRGEIALRIIRALRDLKIESVAIYSEADKHSRHVEMADFSVSLPGNIPADNYLNIPLIVEAIKLSGADAVHPGYGFLAENSDFQRAVEESGAKFIGPSHASMTLLGNKIQARNLMIKNKIPVVPGTEKPLSNLDALKEAVTRIGYPLILKASYGGGGKGMQVVRKDDELEKAYQTCTREALSYFGNADVFAERFIEAPRHIEIQILCDSHGNGVHLFERDCSVQRKHQKLFEEAPSKYLDDAQRNRLGDIAVKAALAAGYEGAGTVEFICDSPDEVFFMEVNTRIQVEHPVTEMVTGIDLISEQVKVAAGEKLSFSQKDIKLNGWSMEARINAEDPSKGFMAAPGQVTRLRFPSGPFVRVESHLYEGYTIPPFYDSMVAKVIVWGATREEASNRMERALREMEVSGVPSTVSFHKALLRNPQFVEGDFTTKFLDENESYFQETFSESHEVSDQDTALMTSLLAYDNRNLGPVLQENPHRELWSKKGRFDSINRGW